MSGDAWDEVGAWWCNKAPAWFRVRYSPEKCRIRDIIQTEQARAFLKDSVRRLACCAEQGRQSPGVLLKLGLYKEILWHSDRSLNIHGHRLMHSLLALIDVTAVLHSAYQLEGGTAPFPQTFCRLLSASPVFDPRLDQGAQALAARLLLDSSPATRLTRWHLLRVLKQLLAVVRRNLRTEPPVRSNRHARSTDERPLKRPRLKSLSERHTTKTSVPHRCVTCVPVPKVHARELTVERLRTQFAKAGVPVVVTGLEVLPLHGVTVEQTLVDLAGQASVGPLRRRVPGSSSWAELEDIPPTADLPKTLEDYFRYARSCDEKTAQKAVTVFDWSIPRHVPSLTSQLRIPRFFAGDLLQRLPPGSRYRDSWPSLFVAPAGSSSGLHVDSMATHFWMCVLQGSKRWSIFRREDTPLLYPVWPYSHNPVFPVDLLDGDVLPRLDGSGSSEAGESLNRVETEVKYPALRRARVYQCMLQPGEVLFVPQGCPHLVESVGTVGLTNREEAPGSVIAVSSNFVDTSNYDEFVDSVHVNSLVDPQSRPLFEELLSLSRIPCTERTADDLSWPQYKMWPRPWEGYHA